MCIHIDHIVKLYVFIGFPFPNPTFHYSRSSSHCSFPCPVLRGAAASWAPLRWRHGMLPVPAVLGQLST